MYGFCELSSASLLREGIQMEASKPGGEQEPLVEEQNATPETTETKSELKDIINSKKAKDTTKGSSCS
jgi:hypothetical protein